MRAIAASAAASSLQDLGAGNCGAKSVRLEKRLDPLEAPLQGPHDSIFIARGEPGFPLVHPARVSFPEHVLLQFYQRRRRCLAASKITQITLSSGIVATMAREITQ